MAELKKEIGFTVMLLIVVNSILGTGIFFLPSIGARIAGPASIISWLILSVFAIYIAACFGELTSMFPKSGGVYEFCKQAYGRFPSFLIGWTVLVTSNITIAMLTLGAIQYLLPFHMPAVKIAISLFFILLFNLVAYRGIKISATMLIGFTFITLGTLAFIIISNFVNFNTSNFNPFFVFPISAVFFAVFFIAETFFGWESPTFLTGETKDGKRNVPKALVLGTIIIALISLVFVVSSLGALNWSLFGASAAPLSDLARVGYGAIGVSIFTILVYVAIIGSVAGWVVSSPRLILSMAKDKLFLKQMAHIHPRFNTPHKAIIFQAVAAMVIVFAGAGNYFTLLEMLLPMLIILYSIVLLGVVVLRFKKPDLKRYFKVPFGKIGPFFVIAFFIFLLGTWIRFSSNAFGVLRLGISFILLGIPLYFLLEMYYDPKMIREVNDIFAYFTLWTEHFFFPKRIRRRVISLLGDIRNKKVLEFGCSVGTLTRHLAEEIKEGIVYATDLSKNDLKIAAKRMERLGHKKKVMMIHDELHHSRVHPSVPNVDVVVSVGAIGYLQDVDNVLKGMNKRLKIGDTICFLDYDKFFFIIPNIEWLSDDDKIMRLFGNAGFKVNIVRRRGIFWQYIYIYGKKVKNKK